MEPTSATLATTTLVKLSEQINAVAAQGNINSSYFISTIAEQTGIFVMIVLLFGGFQLVSLKKDEEKKIKLLSEEIAKKAEVLARQEAQRLESETAIKINEIKNRLEAQVQKLESDMITKVT